LATGAIVGFDFVEVWIVSSWSSAPLTGAFAIDWSASACSSSERATAANAEAAASIVKSLISLIRKKCDVA
jgi:hypothetical protein